MKPARETSCCSPEKATRIIKFSPTTHSNLTIAKWRGAPFAIVVSKGREAVLGLAPSALVLKVWRRRWDPGKTGRASGGPLERRSPQDVENTTSRRECR